ncbi:MAG: hypothetical protein K2I64_03410 [Muribaculaceae bacterium]|nr:hypothetical protein [Muribaculaceae bacterium]
MNLKHLILSIAIILSMPCAWGEHTIVPKDFSELPEFNIAAKFLNKYVSFLDKQQTEEVSDILRRTKEDGFRFIKGNDASLKSLTGSEDFSISFENGIYSAHWAKNGRDLVSCSFPANYGLLTFSNKIDLENQLIKELVQLSSDSLLIDIPVRETSTLTPISFSDFYVEDKGYYITPRLKHQLVFAKSQSNPDSCILLNDSTHYQLESIANTMLSGYSSNQHQLKVKVNQYGYKAEEVATSLPALFTYLSQNGTAPYWGVETFDGQTIKGLWVWINRPGGYAHMLTVTVPTKALSQDSQIEAKLHCYLRLDNLKSLFEEYPEL